MSIYRVYNEHTFEVATSTCFGFTTREHVFRVYDDNAFGVYTEAVFRVYCENAFRVYHGDVFRVNTTNPLLGLKRARF